MFNEKATIILLTAGLIKNILFYKMSYFPEPHIHSKNKIEVELYFSNYATKSDLKNATIVNTLDFVKKCDSANLKSDTDEFDNGKFKNVPSALNNLKSNLGKLNIDKLILVSVDLSKLSVVEKIMLLKRLNKINLLKKLMSLILVDFKKTEYYSKINEIKSEIPSMTGLLTTAAFNYVKSKILEISGLVKKTDYD